MHDLTIWVVWFSCGVLNHDGASSKSYVERFRYSRMRTIGDAISKKVIFYCRRELQHLYDRTPV